MDDEHEQQKRFFRTETLIKYACDPTVHQRMWTLASFPGFTSALILRPIRNVTKADWSEYERTGKAWERGYVNATQMRPHISFLVSVMTHIRVHIHT